MLLTWSFDLGIFTSHLCYPRYRIRTGIDRNRAAAIPCLGNELCTGRRDIIFELCHPISRRPTFISEICRALNSDALQSGFSDEIRKLSHSLAFRIMRKYIRGYKNANQLQGSNGLVNNFVFVEITFVLSDDCFSPLSFQEYSTKILRSQISAVAVQF